jgi:hypothetical protein
VLELFAEVKNLSALKGPLSSSSGMRITRKAIQIEKSQLPRPEIKAGAHPIYHAKEIKQGATPADQWPVK